MSDSAQRNVVLAASTMASFLTPFMGSSINVALPAVAREFSMSAVSLGWVATAYILTAAMFLVPFGKLADILGRKRVFAWGVGVYTLGCVCSALAFSAVSLILFRVIQGIGGAMIFGTSVAILTSVFPPGERGKALGINTAAVYLGLSLGPILGGFLTQQFGWRSIFLATIPLGVAVLILILWKIKEEWAEAHGEQFDFAGAVIFGTALVSFMYGFSRLPSVLGAGLVLFGFLALAGFIKWEPRAATRLLDVKLFRDNRIFAFSNLAALINYSATSAVSFLLSLYLQYVKGFSPQSAGLVLIAQPIVMALFSPLAGRLSDRIEPRIVASLGMSLSSAGLVLFAFLSEGTASPYITLSLICLGFGFALFSSPNTNAIMGSVEKRFYGVASATLGTMRLTGQMLSLGISMMIFSVVIGRVKITPEYYPLFLRSAKIGFVVFAALCVAGVFASLARGNRPGSNLHI